MSLSIRILFLILSATWFASAQARSEHAEPAAKASSASSESKSNPLREGWAAISEIQAGNKRFIDGRSNHAGQDKATREKLASGQQPPVIVLSCSDSRVPPEKIFDQGLGQVFTVRLAGHVVNAEAIASIEYAIEHLGSKALVVMGHDSCGAVKAALTTPKGKSAGSPSLDTLIGKIKPGIATFKGIPSDDPKIEGPVKANVNATVRELVKKSKIVRDAIEKEHLLIGQGIYHLASGEVEFWSLGQPIVISQPQASTKQSRWPSKTKDDEEE